jgi:hypothetical protein
VLSCCCEKLVAERQGLVLEPKGKRTSSFGSLYRVTASEDVTVDTRARVCVCVRERENCKM